jgi:hypothetical protein
VIGDVPLGAVGRRTRRAHRSANRLKTSRAGFEPRRERATSMGFEIPVLSTIRPSISPRRVGARTEWLKTGAE